MNERRAMTPRRAVLGVVAIAVALAMVWFVFFRASDEQKIKDAIARAASAVEVTEDDTNPLFRAARIRGAFKEVVDPAVHATVPDVPALGGGRDALADAATALSQPFRTCAFDVAYDEIALDESKTTARVKAKVTLVGMDRGGARQRETRPVTFLVRKTDAWRIAAITVWQGEDRE